MSLAKKLKSHLSAFFASTAACSLLFTASTASADTPQDVSLVAGMDSLEASRTDLRSRTDDTRIVTQAATTTAESRLVSRRAEDESTAQPVRRRPLSRIMHQLKTTQTDGGGTLLFSDSPEYATEDGILYRDTVQGAARVLYYHVNRMDAPKKVAIVLENRSNGTSMITVSRGGASQPSPHYLDVGKATQALYFDDQQPQRFFLKKGERRVLVQDMDTTVLQPEDLVYGCYDFTTTQAVRTSVVICPSDADPAAFVRHARILPADDLRLRGTFAKADRTIRATHAYNPNKDGIAYIINDVNSCYQNQTVLEKGFLSWEEDFWYITNMWCKMEDPNKTTYNLLSLLATEKRQSLKDEEFKEFVCYKANITPERYEKIINTDYTISYDDPYSRYEDIIEALDDESEDPRVVTKALGLYIQELDEAEDDRYSGDIRREFCALSEEECLENAINRIKN